MVRGSALVLALVVTGPLVWDTFVTSTVSVSSFLVHYLVAVLIIAVLLAALRGALRTSTKPELERLDRATPTEGQGDC